MNRSLSGDAEVQRCDDTIDFDWGRGGPGSVADGFSARWTKTVRFPSTGDYEVTIGADDGIRMFVDGVKVYDRWVDKGFSTEVVDVPITAGDRVITVEYYDNGLDARARMAIATTPNGYDYCATLPNSGWTFGGWGPGAWSAAHWTNKTLDGSAAATVTRSEVNENYGSAQNPVIGRTDDFSIRWTRTIDVASNCSVRFRGGGDDGFRLRIDGNLVLDDWSNHGYRTKEADHTLTAGTHTIVYEFYESGGDARAALEWRRN